MPRIPSKKAIGLFFRSTTARLAASYLAIIMLMSIGFSIVFYTVSARELGPHGPRPAPAQNQSGSGSGGTGSSTAPSDTHPRIDRDPAVAAYLKQREKEGKRELLKRLIGLNILALVAGSGLSYYLARRTLKPIEENMEAQAQFVSDASHELRTPLTALQTTNEVALRKAHITDADARDLLHHNVAEVAKLQGLTTSLLKLAKSDASEVRLIPVSIPKITSDAMNSVISAAQTRNITIEDTVPNARVLADPAAITQVLVILLDNAIKYSSPDSRIRIAGTKNSRIASIDVSDLGQGIPAKDLPHIFDRFYRAEQSRTTSKSGGRVDGYGIGLSLAMKLVHQMGGEIVVKSVEGTGSTFTVRLPLA